MPSPRKPTLRVPRLPHYSGRRDRHRAARLTINLTVLALLPLWPFVAYPLQRGHWMRVEQGTHASRTGSRSILLYGITFHPVVTALGAPMRFLASRRRAAGRGGGGYDGPPGAGVREPRRPKSGPPQDSIAVPEPQI